MATNPNDTAYSTMAGDIGLTKRELFAAMAMQGLCADRNFNGYIHESAVEIADALIKELNK